MNLSLSLHFLYPSSQITQTQVYKSWFVSVLNSLGNIYSVLEWYQQILVSNFNHHHLFPVSWVTSGFALTWNFLHYNSKPCLTRYFLWVKCPPCLWEISCVQISDRHGMLQKNFTSRSSVVLHKGLAWTLQFFFWLRIPRHRISPWMVETPPYFFFSWPRTLIPVHSLTAVSHSHADLILWAIPYVPERVDWLILFCRCISES